MLPYSCSHESDISNVFICVVAKVWAVWNILSMQADSGEADYVSGVV